MSKELLHKQSQSQSLVAQQVTDVRLSKYTSDRGIRARLGIQEIRVPTMPANIDALSVLQRVSLVAFYMVLRLEYAISPRGLFRACVKLLMGISLVMAIAALTIIPLIAYFLGTFFSWSDIALHIAVNVKDFIWMLYYIAALITAPIVVIFIVLHVRSRR